MIEDHAVLFYSPSCIESFTEVVAYFLQDNKTREALFKS